jgi:hypothetical protein
LEEIFHLGAHYRPEQRQLGNELFHSLWLQIVRIEISDEVAERKIGTKMLGFQPANFGGANVFDSDKVHLSVSDYADNTRARTV